MPVLQRMSVVNQMTPPSSSLEDKKWFEPTLHIMSRLLAKTQKGTELTIYLRMANFIKVIVISIAKRSCLIDHIQSWVAVDELKGYDPGILRAFIELGSKIGIIQVNGNLIRMEDKYRSSQYGTGQEIIEQISMSNWNGLQSYKKVEVNHFIFIYLLICLHNKKTVGDDLLKRYGIDSKWLDVVHTKSFEYEIILSEYILELLEVNLQTKIKFSKHEEFYTCLGRKAFELFTKENFSRTVHEMVAVSSIQTVLDIGCGYGDYIDVISQISGVEQVVGIERQSNVYNEVNNRFADRGNVEIINENIFDVDTEKKFDLILINYVMFYFSEEEKVNLLKKLHDLLSEDGQIMICQYYPTIENIQKKLAASRNDLSFEKQIAMFLGNILLYSEVLLNETLDDFKQSERWQSFCDLVKQTGMSITHITNADKFYYSFYIVIKKIQ